MSRPRTTGLLASTAIAASMLMSGVAPAAAADIPGTTSKLTAAFCEGGPGGWGHGGIGLIARARVDSLPQADTVIIRLTMQSRIDGAWQDGVSERFTKQRPAPGAWRFVKPWNVSFHPADLEFENRIKVVFRYIDHKPGTDSVLSQTRYGPTCPVHPPVA